MTIFVSYSRRDFRPVHLSKFPRPVSRGMLSTAEQSAQEKSEAALSGRVNLASDMFASLVRAADLQAQGSPQQQRLPSEVLPELLELVSSIAELIAKSPALPPERLH